ncbi:type III-A CRISPR-associated protein Csm2 [Desulfosoma caldarium]|uniref:CRISPR system Cms protein Csm2 n=1 Tax=Desulfosoma caldarium TaxID=610254 RepID=A0A3N1UQN1_9BACT|nr:type III-A CRISPR-associated protein Csm2 [Desulfosoma caldarium]ROQ92048.1 CRISPR-associated protein Csm2 [Desulfosoma caldarium]
MSGGTDQTNIKQFRAELADLKKLSMDRLVDIADAVGKAVARQVKMNQIRRFLDGARKVEAQLKNPEDFDKVKDQIVLLRPKLAYAAGRHRDVKDLAELLDPAVKSAAQTHDNFMKFLRFMESIIAYHRYHGGKD